MRRLEDFVREAAAAVPDRIAVADSRESWTYRELDAASDRLARDFQARGVTRGDRVAVCSPKSVRAVAAMQAALRLGAAYIPVDPAMPAARAEKILADGGVRLVVTTQTLQDLGALPAPPLPPVESGPDELAYILYTSGSTGTPKGVCLSHRNALAFVEWAVAAIRSPEAPVYSNHASFGFDLSVLDLYGAFLSRGSVRLVPETIAYSAPKLVEFLRQNPIAVWYSVPSVLMLMMEHGGLLEAGLRPPGTVIFAGEPFPMVPLRKLRKAWSGSRFFNFYGPTETNVCAAFEVGGLPDERTSVPIGTAASGDRIWAVKEDGTVAQEGEQGELWVEGPSVMLGYWGQEPQRGPYRTGDLCRLGAGGHYEFIGRVDHLVKVRGYRIELGEIEAVLGGHPNVREIAVLPFGEGLDRRLAAFVVPRESPPPTLIQLKTFGAKSLPAYMLVDRVVGLAALPRTPNGKVDRAALALKLGP